MIFVSTTPNKYLKCNQLEPKMQPVRTKNATSSNGCKILTNIINTMVRDSNQNIKFNGKTWKKMRLFETNCTRNERTLERSKVF